MIGEFDLAVALGVWTLGATVYTWQLWKKRGLSDTGVAGLVLLTVGALLVGVVVARVSIGAGILFAGASGGFPAVILWMRALDKVRYYERLIHDRMARSAPPPEAVHAGLSRVGEAGKPVPPPVPPPPEVLAEEARSTRIARMFGG